MEIEFRIINTAEMPPIIITQGDEDKPKVVINSYHTIWIGLHRKTIAGIIMSVQEKMDMLLDGFLKEQRKFEIDDEHWNSGETDDIWNHRMGFYYCMCNIYDAFGINISPPSNINMNTLNSGKKDRKIQEKLKW